MQVTLRAPEEKRKGHRERKMGRRNGGQTGWRQTRVPWSQASRLSSGAAEPRPTLARAVSEVPESHGLDADLCPPCSGRAHQLPEPVPEVH